MSHGAEVGKPTNDGRCQSCGNDRVDMGAEDKCWRCGSEHLEYKDGLGGLEFILEEDKPSEAQRQDAQALAFQGFYPPMVLQVDLTKLKPSTTQSPHCVHRNKRSAYSFPGYTCVDCGDYFPWP